MSLTAYVVTATVAGLAAEPRWAALVDEETRTLARAFARHAPDDMADRLVSRVPTEWLVAILERAFVPGMAWHYLFRKHWIEAETRRAIAAGARQVLVLGAGYDSLGPRLARAFGEVRVVEVDRRPTQDHKRDILAKLGWEIPPNLAFLPGDLTEPMLEGAIHPELPTVVVAEGVLMYLDEPSVEALFRGLHRVVRADLTVLFGATATPDTAGDWRLRLVNRALASRGEGTSWCCPAHRMPAFLASLGFSVADAVTYRDLQRRHRTEQEIRRVPREDENYYRAVRSAQDLHVPLRPVHADALPVADPSRGPVHPDHSR